MVLSAVELLVGVFGRGSGVEESTVEKSGIRRFGKWQGSKNHLLD